MREARRHIVTAVLVAGVCGAGIVAPLASAAKQFPPGRDPLFLAFHDLTFKVAPKLGAAYGCVAQPGDGTLVLLVTDGHAVRSASRMVAKLHFKAPVKVRVIDPRNSEARVVALGDDIANGVGLANPDVLVTESVNNTGWRSCGTVNVTMSSGAPAWVAQLISSRQLTNGPDRLTVTVVPPEQMPVMPRVVAD
jgi:hypothetical protein